MGSYPDMEMARKTRPSKLGKEGRGKEANLETQKKPERNNKKIDGKIQPSKQGEREKKEKKRKAHKPL